MRLSNCNLKDLGLRMFSRKYILNIYSEKSFSKKKCKKRYRQFWLINIKDGGHCDMDDV